MEQFWILILILFFATNSPDKSESVKLEELEELPLQTFDELFVEEWLDKGEAEDLKTPPPTNFGQNVHHQIDRQNTQIGQIEPNSADQNSPLTESDHLGQIEPNSADQNSPLTESDHLGQIEPNSTDQNSPLTESDHSGQIEPNSTDQNPPLTESDHSDNAKIDEEPNELMQEITSNEKRKIIDEFHAIKDQFKQKGKFSAREWTQIEQKIVKHLNVSRKKIYKWQKEFGLSRKMFKEKEERKHLIEKFDQMKAEFKRAGIKNSQNELDKTVAKELGLSFRTICRWKNQTTAPRHKHKHSYSKQKKLMKRYYEIKDKTPKISDENIAKMLKIGRFTLYKWKKQFKRQKFHPNSVN